MTRLTVALVAAAGIALQAAFLHVAVAAPLGTALADLRAPDAAPRPSFEETIQVVAAKALVHKAVKPAKRS
jgi:hypothetical protein